MAKRYAFFCNDRGEPHKNQNERIKHAPTEMLRELGQKSISGVNGFEGWSPCTLSAFAPALRASFAVERPDGRKLNETDSWNILLQSLRKFCQEKPGVAIDPDQLIKNADWYSTELFSRKCEPHVLVTSLLIDEFPADSITICDCRISRVNNRATEFPLPQGLVGQSLSEHAEKYTSVKVDVDGFSVHDAFEAGSNALDILRGLWSLFAAKEGWSVTSRDGLPPLGIIHMGPIITLHKPDGSLACDLHWSCPEILKGRRVFAAEGRWAEIEEDRRVANERIEASGYKVDMHDLLVRYATALDQLDPGVVFFQLWSMLEKITNTTDARSYDETIRRAAWIFSQKNRPVNNEMLRSLRIARNRYAHSSKLVGDMWQVAQLAKRLVDPHLLQLIENHFSVSRLDEYGTFLSQPADIGKLQKRVRSAELAIKFHQGAEGGEC